MIDAPPPIRPLPDGFRRTCRRVDDAFDRVPASQKGFDGSIRSFAELSPVGARLYVVGSLWRADEISEAHLQELQRLADETPGVELHVGYLSTRSSIAG